jgi:hypothetical protein
VRRVPEFERDNISAIRCIAELFFTGKSSQTLKHLNRIKTVCFICGVICCYVLYNITDFFTRNLHYASTYWEEHSLNFAEMLDKLMNEQTLEKLCANASMMVLVFNQKCGIHHTHTKHTLNTTKTEMSSSFISPLFPVCARLVL